MLSNLGIYNGFWRQMRQEKAEKLINLGTYSVFLFLTHSMSIFGLKKCPILVTTQHDGADSAIINCGWNHYAAYVRVRAGLPLPPCAIIFIRTAAEMMTCFGADRSNRFALRAITATNEYRRYTARC